MFGSYSVFSLCVFFVLFYFPLLMCQCGIFLSFFSILGRLFFRLVNSISDAFYCYFFVLLHWDFSIFNISRSFSKISISLLNFSSMLLFSVLLWNFSSRVVMLSTFFHLQLFPLCCWLSYWNNLFVSILRSLIIFTSNLLRSLSSILPI